MRSPIVWFGGKGNMVKNILPYITEHREYIEPFFGGGSVFFAKRPAKVETVNDLNSDVMHFFRILRDDPEEFLRLCHLTPYSRELFYECFETYEQEEGVRRAWKWFVVARQSFGGMFGSSWGFAVTLSTRNMAGTCSNFLSAIDRLPQVIQRLKRTQIENTDALKVIETYSTPTSLCYCDPPYMASTRKCGGYEHEMDDTMHTDLLDLLVTNPGKVILSGYPNELYDNKLAGWKRIDIETACYAAAKTRNSKLQGKGAALKHQARTESLWLNPVASRAVGEQRRLFG